MKHILKPIFIALFKFIILMFLLAICILWTPIEIIIQLAHLIWHFKPLSRFTKDLTEESYHTSVYASILYIPLHSDEYRLLKRKFNQLINN